MINALLTTTISSDDRIVLLCREVELPSAPTEGLSVRTETYDEPITILEVTYDVESGLYQCDCGHDETDNDDLLDLLAEYAGWTILNISPIDSLFDLDEIDDFDC